MIFLLRHMIFDASTMRVDRSYAATTLDHLSSTQHRECRTQFNPFGVVVYVSTCVDGVFRQVLPLTQSLSPVQMRT